MRPSNTPIPTYVISGNIAAGKSSTGPTLARMLNGLFIAEPVDQWRRDGKLQEFYETKDAYSFQTYVIRTRVNAFNWAIADWKHDHGGQDPLLIVMDRWLGDDLVFAEVTHSEGLMADEKLLDYKKLNEELGESLKGRLDVRKIFIDIPPIECYRRMRTRGREEEQNISLEYLSSLDEALRKQNADIVHAPGSATQEETAMRLSEIINQRYRSTIIVAEGVDGYGYRGFGSTIPVKLLLWAIAGRTLVIKQTKFNKLPIAVQQALRNENRVEQIPNPGKDHVYLCDWPHHMPGNLVVIKCDESVSGTHPVPLNINDWRQTHQTDNIYTYVSN